MSADDLLSPEALLDHLETIAEPFDQATFDQAVDAVKKHDAAQRELIASAEASLRDLIPIAATAAARRARDEGRNEGNAHAERTIGEWLEDTGHEDIAAEMLAGKHRRHVRRGK